MRNRERIGLVALGIAIGLVLGILIGPPRPGPEQPLPQPSAPTSPAKQPEEHPKAEEPTKASQPEEKQPSPEVQPAEPPPELTVCTEMLTVSKSPECVIRLKLKGPQQDREHAIIAVGIALGLLEFISEEYMEQEFTLGTSISAQDFVDFACQFVSGSLGEAVQQAVSDVKAVLDREGIDSPDQVDNALFGFLKNIIADHLGEVITGKFITDTMRALGKDPADFDGITTSRVLEGVANRLIDMAAGRVWSKLETSQQKESKSITDQLKEAGVCLDLEEEEL